MLVAELDERVTSMDVIDVSSYGHETLKECAKRGVDLLVAGSVEQVFPSGPMLQVVHAPADARDLTPEFRKGWEGALAFPLAIGPRPIAPVDIQRWIAGVADRVEIGLEVARQPSRRTGVRTILWAEDEHLLRELIEAYVESLFEDLEVTCVGDGREALAFFDHGKHDVDVIVSDVQMPVMDGPAFFRRIAPAASMCVPLLLEGCDFFSECSDLKTRGAIFGTLSPPWRLDEFSAVIDRCLRIKDAMDELAFRNQEARCETGD
ncbi:MAG: response regulator [Planctomycetota bacterium]|jgi:FixJ family two-component response regulator